MIEKTKKNFYYLAVAGLILSVIGLVYLLGIAQKGLAEEEILCSNLRVTEGSTLLPEFSPLGGSLRVAQKIKVVVTGYSSSVWETQGDPFITASGMKVRDGIVANNLLPFGTLIRLPELFGDKIFVVEDRMNPKKGYYHIDVWFPSREEALRFGSKITEMEILSN